MQMEGHYASTHAETTVHNSKLYQVLIWKDTKNKENKQTWVGPLKSHDDDDRTWEVTQLFYKDWFDEFHPSEAKDKEPSIPVLQVRSWEVLCFPWRLICQEIVPS